MYSFYFQKKKRKNLVRNKTSLVYLAWCSWSDAHVWRIFKHENFFSNTKVARKNFISYFISIEHVCRSFVSLYLYICPLIFTTFHFLQFHIPGIRITVLEWANFENQIIIILIDNRRNGREKILRIKKENLVEQK